MGLSLPALRCRELEGMDSMILWRGCLAGGCFPVPQVVLWYHAPKVNGSSSECCQELGRFVLHQDRKGFAPWAVLVP